jgi:hypothetical protein
VSERNFQDCPWARILQSPNLWREEKLFRGCAFSTYIVGLSTYPMALARRTRKCLFQDIRQHYATKNPNQGGEVRYCCLWILYPTRFHHFSKSSASAQLTTTEAGGTILSHTKRSSVLPRKSNMLRHVCPTPRPVKQILSHPRHPSKTLSTSLSSSPQ